MGSGGLLLHQQQMILLMNLLMNSPSLLVHHDRRDRHEFPNEWNREFSEGTMAMQEDHVQRRWGR